MNYMLIVPNIRKKLKSNTVKGLQVTLKNSGGFLKDWIFVTKSNFFAEKFWIKRVNKHFGIASYQGAYRVPPVLFPSI
jgi:hypothetical protein